MSNPKVTYYVIAFFDPDTRRVMYLTEYPDDPEYNSDHTIKGLTHDVYQARRFSLAGAEGVKNWASGFAKTVIGEHKTIIEQVRTRVNSYQCPHCGEMMNAYMCWGCGKEDVDALIDDGIFDPNAEADK